MKRLISPFFGCSTQEAKFPCQVNKSGRNGFTTKKLKRAESSFTPEKSPYEEIEFIPQVYLSVKQMREDPLPLITKLEAQYAAFGAVKIITPPEWNPPFCFKFASFSVPTRVQPLDQLKFGKPFKEKRDPQSLNTFLDFSKNFEKQYRFSFPKKGESREASLEEEYWNIVRGVEGNPAHKSVTVEYAADLPSDKFSSGFPTYYGRKSCDQFFDYSSNLFNLNNTFRSEKSLLGISEQRGQTIGGITVPWVYIGMQFSTFCWHVQDCEINSLNYSHQGKTKVWYVVPGSNKAKFDSYFLEHYKRELLDRITFMIDPIDLIKHGIKVYKTYQRPGDYICTFLSAYHCGFATGFNVGEAVNILVNESLKQLYDGSLHKNKKPSLFCYNWVVYRNHERKALLQKEYQQMLAQESKAVCSLMRNTKIKQLILFSDDLKYDKYSCTICKRYLFLSFIECLKCGTVSCIYHFQKCCSTGYSIHIREPNADRSVLLEHVRFNLPN